MISPPDQEKEWPQILAISIANLSALTFGILHFWTSPSIAILLSADTPLKITFEEASYLTVIPAVAVALTAFPASILVDTVGRKYSLIILAIPQILSWVLIGIGNSIWVYYLSRLVTGFAEAILLAALPAYIGEVSSPKIRGSWGNGLTFITHVGCLMVNLVGGCTSIRTAAYIMGVIPIIFLILFPFMPETPYYHIMKGRHDEAKQTLRWLRQKINVDEEFESIRAGIQKQLSEEGTIKDLFCVNSNRRALSIAILLRITQQFSGISAFLMYSQYMFNEAGGSVSANTSAAVCAAVLSIGTLFISGTLNFIGRRKAIFISATGCITMLIFMGTYMCIKQYTNLIKVSSIPMFGMIAFIIMFSVGLGSIPTLMLSELFSSKIKPKALALMNIVFSICIVITTKLFHFLSSSLGLYAAFYFFAFCCLICTCVCYFSVPETNGKSLEQIQQELKTPRKFKSATRKPSISLINTDRTFIVS